MAENYIIDETLQHVLHEPDTIFRKEYLRHQNTLLFNADVLKSDIFKIPFIDIIVTSPPYNVGIDYNSNNDELDYEQYLIFSEKWMRNCFEWSKTQARFCLNIP